MKILIVLSSLLFFVPYSFADQSYMPDIQQSQPAKPVIRLNKPSDTERKDDISGAPGAVTSGSPLRLPSSDFGSNAPGSPAKTYIETYPVPDQVDPLSSVSAYPDIANVIDLSSSDVNVLVCPTDIRDGDEGVTFSQEKHVRIKVKGRYAFVKFQVRESSAGDGSEKMSYAAAPAEILVLCEDSMYKIIATPRRIPSTTVYLSQGSAQKFKKNLSLYGDMPFKKKIVSILKSVYREDIPDSFKVTNIDKPIVLFKDLDLKLRRTIRIDGEGLRVKEYVASLKHGIEKLALDEKQFLRSELTSNPAFIAVDPLSPVAGDTVRIFIFEHTKEGA